MSQPINNPNLAFGYTDLQTRGPSQIGVFKTSAAIAGAPQVVSIGTTGLVAESATDGNASLALGIALDNCESGGTTRVVLGGLAENVPCDGATTAGSSVARSATTTGSVSVPATNTHAIGISIGASASSTCDVWVFKHTTLS